MNLEQFRKDIIKNTTLENYHTVMDIIESWSLTDMNLDELKEKIGLKMYINVDDELLDERLRRDKEGDDIDFALLDKGGDDNEV